jgi:hypothetical protein
MARHYANKEEINAILNEDKRRLDIIFGNHNQLTGYGMEGHTHKVEIKDYALKVQYLTDEVFNNNLYQSVIETGSISSYVDLFNKENETSISEEDVSNALFTARCARDPSFAFYTLDKIKDKLGGDMIPFKLNYAQRVLLFELEKMRWAGVPIRMVLLKARQWGGSTLVQLYISWVQLFVKTGWYSVIIAQTKDTAKRIKAMYEKALEKMPGFPFGVEGLKFSPYKGSSSDSIITNTSGTPIRDNVTTIASFENFESTRGMDFAMAHFSEVAYWKPTPSKTPEQVITNIASNMLEVALTIEILESTANGMSGLFYDEYQMAKAGTSSSKALFIPFFWIENDMLKFDNGGEKWQFVEKMLAEKGEKVAPDDNSEPGEYIYGLWLKGASLESIKWYIQKRKTFHDHASMASEAPADDIECFKYSGHLVFNIYLCEERKEQYAELPIFKGDVIEDKAGNVKLETNQNGELYIWEYPNNLQTEDEYIVIVDVGGRSKGADYSVITVISRWGRRFKGGKDKVVARWRGHIRYDWLAYKAVKIAKYYKNAKLVFESNTYDKKKAEASEYVEQGDHIRGILTKIQDIYKNLYMRAATDPEDLRKGIYKKVGFQTNVKTKQDMVDNHVVLIEDDMFIDPDSRVYAEMSIYEQRPDGSYGNIKGANNHDDIIMTDMIGGLLSGEMPKPELIKRENVSSRIDNYPRNESSL